MSFLPIYVLNLETTGPGPSGELLPQATGTGNVLLQDGTNLLLQTDGAAAPDVRPARTYVIQDRSRHLACARD